MNTSPLVYFRNAYYVICIVFRLMLWMTFGIPKKEHAPVMIGTSLEQINGRTTKGALGNH